MTLDLLPVPGGDFPSGGTVIPADRHQPVVARSVLLAQNFRGNSEIAVWVEKCARLIDSMAVIAEVDLAEANIDASGGILFERAV